MKSKIKINDTAINEGLKDLLVNYVGKPWNEDLQNKMIFKAAQILYKHGFEDDYDSANFKPVIPGVNLMVGYHPWTRILEIKYKTKPSEKWTTVFAASTRSSV
jgi:hypothetical protein